MRLLWALWVLILFLLMTGCATSGAQTDLTGVPRIRTVTAGTVSSAGETVVAGATSLRYEEEPVVTEEAMDAPSEEVLAALLGAFGAEGIAPDGMDLAAGVISLSRFEWPADRDGRRPSDFLDCGPSTTGRALADDARVVAGVAAQVQEAGAGSSRVIVLLTASAFPFGNLDGPVRSCTSTGLLERTLLEHLRNAVSEGSLPSPATDAVPSGPPRARDSIFTPTEDLPLLAGDRLRVRTVEGDRLTGSFLELRTDSLVLGTGRRTAVPLEQILEIRVKRTERFPLLAGTLAGMVAGIALATTTDLGIVGSHAAQGRILNPGLGALAGGLAGALLGSKVFGTTWVTVPVDAVRSRGPGL